MKPWIMCVILLPWLLLPAVLAADITFTAGQQEYFFLVGEPAEIPLAVTSSYPADVPGTVQFSTDEQLQKPGTILVSTRNRVYSQVVPPGRSFLNLSAGASGVPHDYKVHISFDYTETSPVHVSLPEILIHIVSDPGQVKNVQAVVKSTSGPGSGDVPATSSVIVVEQTVSAREQMGSDSTRNRSFLESLSRQDADALRQQLERDQENRAREQSEFDELLAKDPLILEVNESLVADGFTRQVLDTRSASNANGTFSIVYRKGVDRQVVVQGSMQDGIVPSVRERSAAAIPPGPALAANVTFKSFETTLKEQGYGLKETVIDRTLKHMVVSSMYAGNDGEKVFLNATAEGNRVIQVTLEQETGPSPFPQILLIAFAAAVFSLCVWLVIWKYYPSGFPGNPAHSPPSAAEPFDHRREAEQLLESARQAFDGHRYPEAYGLAGRALRLFLSYEYGDHAEVTSMDIIMLFRITGKDVRDIQAVLERCNDVAFAKGEPDTPEFLSIVLRIRKIIVRS